MIVIMLNKTYKKIFAFFRKIIKLICYEVHFTVDGKIFVLKINLAKQMF